MLVTRQPVLRRFWYPVMPLDHLADGPRPFTLLGEAIVLWQLPDGTPVALKDRCCHRTAKLSCGWVEGERIICGYHGWAYDRTGQVVSIPQQPERQPDERLRTPGYHAQARYGYVWVALEDPLEAIPEIPEIHDPGFRRIDEFYEVWRAPGLRIMENSFDNAHFSYVHRASFGVQEDPEPAPLELVDEGMGFSMITEVAVKNPEIQKRNLGIQAERTVRRYRKTYWMPFSRKMHVTYPNGLVHIIVTCTAPIDDGHSQVIQFALRNDTEEDAPAERVIAFDRQVTSEDRRILEVCEHDVPLATASGEEYHMPSDRPGLEMRKRLARLLEAHGETEVRDSRAPTCS